MLEKQTININSRFDSNDEKFDTKFDKLSSNVNKHKVKCESSFNELIKRLDESDEKWEKLIDSTKQVNNGYNTESVCANENRNKEVTVNKVCLLYTSRCV